MISAGTQCQLEIVLLGNHVQVNNEQGSCGAITEELVSVRPIILVNVTYTNLHILVNVAYTDLHILVNVAYTNLHNLVNI